MFYKHLRIFVSLVAWFQHKLTWKPLGSNIEKYQGYKKYQKNEIILPR